LEETAAMDRRRYQRLPREVAVDITYVDPATNKRKEVERSCSRNLSAVGLLVTADHRFNVGDTVEVKFYLPGSPECLRLNARVVRVEEVAREQFYDLGLEFLEIDKAALARINSLANQELSG
jgi:c-di-GMP-binding flagellar brake protein YcgR